jgi:hypothetical protein
MASGVKWDSTDFIKKTGELLLTFDKRVTGGVNDVAYEILRLSTFEVPHDTGMLQNSGHVEQAASADQDAIVGYNKVYAARLHEHPEYRFQKGRKGKYLEDPIKRNLRIFIKYIQKAING